MLSTNFLVGVCAPVVGVCSSERNRSRSSSRKSCSCSISRKAGQLTETLLNVSKACGPDSITPFLLKSSAEYISVPLSHLFNQSLSTGTLPFDWVSANVVPIHKRNDKHIPGNYRPISLPSVVIKVFERIIHQHLVSALESHHLLSPSQSGFRTRRSTVTLLTEAVSDWSLCLEQRGTVHCLLLDFAKAFDSVPHERLLLSWVHWEFMVMYSNG